MAITCCDKQWKANIGKTVIQSVWVCWLSLLVAAESIFIADREIVVALLFIESLIKSKKLERKNGQKRGETFSIRDFNWFWIVDVFNANVNINKVAQRHFHRSRSRVSLIFIAKSNQKPIRKRFERATHCLLIICYNSRNPVNCLFADACECIASITLIKWWRWRRRRLYMHDS